VRKLWWLAAIAFAALTLAACGGDDEGGGSGGGETTAADANAEIKLQTPGQLTAGAEFPVPGFLELPIENPKGFEVDFAKALARELGVDRVKWVNTPFSGMFSPAPKKYDVGINEITITPERDKVVDFSEPYFDADQGFLINKGGPGAQAKSIADMKDLQFGFQATTTGGTYINDTIKPTKQPREYSTLGAASQALANGQIDAFVMDVAIGAGVVKRRGEDVAMTGKFVTGEKYGVLLEQGNPLRERVNQAIAKMRESGELADMQAKWFPGSEDLPELK
jgi:polar amino acid transport system substrate-binding protein